MSAVLTVVLCLFLNGISGGDPGPFGYPGTRGDPGQAGCIPTLFARTRHYALRVCSPHLMHCR